MAPNSGAGQSAQSSLTAVCAQQRVISSVDNLAMVIELSRNRTPGACPSSRSVSPSSIQVHSHDRREDAIPNWRPLDGTTSHFSRACEDAFLGGVECVTSQDNLRLILAHS